MNTNDVLWDPVIDKVLERYVDTHENVSIEDLGIVQAELKEMVFTRSLLTLLEKDLVELVGVSDGEAVWKKVESVN